MTATIALAGDTMLGRGVAGSLMRDRAAPLVAPEVVEQLARADAVVLNLECCISDGGTPFPDPAKRFLFRAPPVAAERLAELGVDAVTLANNHALDYGPQALLDTLRHLERAGVAAVGAGADDSCRTGRQPRHDRDRTATRCSSRRTGGPTWSARR
jgi:poly-gamma-glutamate synthesis protein (capsule biosynthesis protein)